MRGNNGDPIARTGNLPFPVRTMLQTSRQQRPGVETKTQYKSLQHTSCTLRKQWNSICAVATERWCGSLLSAFRTL